MISASPKPHIPVYPKPKPKRLPLRKAMTIAAGFEFDGGIMLCADTKIAADIKTNESKLLWMIHKEKCVTVFGISANDFDLAKAAVRQCEEAIGKIHFENIDMSGIRNSIESSLAKFYKTNIFPNPDFRAQMEFLEHF